MRTWFVGCGWKRLKKALPAAFVYVRAGAHASAHTQRQRRATIFRAIFNHQNEWGNTREREQEGKKGCNNIKQWLERVVKRLNPKHPTIYNGEEISRPIGRLEAEWIMENFLSLPKSSYYIRNRIGEKIKTTILLGFLVLLLFGGGSDPLFSHKYQRKPCCISCRCIPGANWPGVVQSGCSGARALRLPNNFAPIFLFFLIHVLI